MRDTHGELCGGGMEARKIEVDVVPELSSTG
jgi:hypothetical protein